MNAEETAKVLAVLTVAYPNLADDKARERVNLWHAMFADEPYSLVYSAVQQFIATDTKGYAPAIGQIKEICAKTVNPAIGDWTEGWGQVNKAIGKYGSWDKAGAMSSFDDTTAEAVRRLGWEEICSSQNIETTRAQFRQTYELISKRESEQIAIPAKIKAQLGELKLLGGKV